MYTTKKTAPEKNSPFNLHEQDQGEGHTEVKHLGITHKCDSVFTVLSGMKRHKKGNILESLTSVTNVNTKVSLQ